MLEIAGGILIALLIIGTIEIWAPVVGFLLLVALGLGLLIGAYALIMAYPDEIGGLAFIGLSIWGLVAGVNWLEVRFKRKPPA